MIFIFTSSNSIASRLIEWGLGCKYSHFAIAECNLSDAFVIDSTFEADVQLQKLYYFKKKYTRIVAFDIPTIDSKESQRIFAKLYSELKDKKYDRKGVSFLSLAVLFYKKIFKKPLPRENKWADRNAYFCSEILSIIEDDLLPHGVDFKKYSNQMITPDIAFNELIKPANVIYIPKVTNG